MNGKKKTAHTAAASRWLLAVLLLTLAVALISPSDARASTYVSGRISEDATWTADGSPYVLTGEVELAHGARLSIEAGTRLMGGGHHIEVYGHLTAQGSVSAPVVMRDVRLRGRGVYLLPSTLETFTIDVRHADINGGSLQGGGLSMYGSWLLRDSIVTNTDEPMYLWYPRADCVIERNLFLNTARISTGLHAADLYVTNNFFYRSASESPRDVCVENWAAFNGHHAGVAFNTFASPGMLAVSLPEWSSSGSLGAANNFWSVPADDADAISSMIFDRNDDLSSPATVEYAPALDTHAPGTPVHRLPLGTALNLEPETTTPLYPNGTHLDVCLTDEREAAVEGAIVALEKSSDGVEWQTVAEVASDADGTARFDVDPADPTFYRAVTAGAPGVYASAESPAVLLTPTHTTSLTIVPSSVRVGTGTSVTLTGTLSGPWGYRLAGRDVALESSADGVAWQPVGTVRTTGDGLYAFSVAPARKAHYRVVFNGESHYAPAVSPTSVVTSLQPVHRFFNFKTGVHFYTVSETEKANVIANLSGSYRYEGVGYTLDLSNPAMDTPLYRFYNVRSGVHFYTATQAERDDVMENLAQVYRYEGVAYTVSRTPTGGTPVYRFLNTKQGVHFYTASEAEKNDVISRLSTTYRFEGVAYYIHD